MKFNWQGNHAEAGPYKLNVWGSGGRFTAEVSLPGICVWGIYDFKTELEAKAGAEEFVVGRLEKFLTDLDIELTVVKSPDDKATCPYGCHEGMVRHWGWKDGEHHGKGGLIEAFVAPCPRHGQKVPQ